MTKRLFTLIACALILSAAVGCTKKEDPALAALAALQAQMQEMQAELEKARSGNASAEEIAKLETAIAEIAEQEQQAEHEIAAPDTTPSTTPTAVTPAATATTTPATPTTTTATPAATTTTTTAPASTSTANANVIPAGTTRIRAADYSQRSLTGHLTIPDSVTYIELGAFSMSFLTSVTIPNSVTYIGADAFTGYEQFRTRNQLTSLVIPDSVTYIGPGAFRGNKLTSLTLGNGLIEIGGNPYSGAFENNQLTSVTIPNSVTTIGDYAFASNKLTSITLGNGVVTIGQQAFDGHFLTGSLVIPNSVTTIGLGAFRGYAGSNVTSLTIGNRVTSIEGGAFMYLNLTSVTIPASVRTIGYSAFQQTNPISRVTFEGDGVRLETDGDSGVGPFDGNLHQVYNGRGTYVRGSNGQWTKQVETGERITANTSLYAEPSANARVIRPINAGQTVSVLHNTGGTSSTPITATDSAGNTWAQVVYGGDEGWVRLDYFSGR